VVLCGCETKSLTLRIEYRLLEFDRVRRRIFGPKRDEMIIGCRKLHNEGLHNLYSSQSILRMVESRRMRRVGYIAGMEKRNAYRYWWEIQKESDH
jgi:hypothetical protein